MFAQAGSQRVALKHFLLCIASASRIWSTLFPGAQYFLTDLHFFDLSSLIIILLHVINKTAAMEYLTHEYSKEISVRKHWAYLFIYLKFNPPVIPLCAISQGDVISEDFTHYYVFKHKYVSWFNDELNTCPCQFHTMVSYEIAELCLTSHILKICIQLDSGFPVSRSFESCNYIIILFKT